MLYSYDTIPKVIGFLSLQGGPWDSQLLPPHMLVCVCMYVYVYTCTGLPPGHLADPPVMYWAPTRTSGWSSSHVLGFHQDILVILQSCIGLPPGLLGDPPIMYYAPTRTSVLSSSDVLGSHQDIWVILHDI